MKNTPIILSSISLLIAIFVLYEQSDVKSKLNSTLGATHQVEASDSAGDKKLVVVDFQDIYNAYRAQSNADAELNAAIGNANKALNVKRTELGELMKKIQANQAALKKPKLNAQELAKIKTEATQQIQKANQLNQLITQQTQLVQQNVNQESLRINQGLYADLQRIIKRKAQTKGYHYVINSQAQDLTQTPIFLYSQETVDLTGELMKEMGLSPVRSASASATPTIPKEQPALPAPKEEAPAPAANKEGAPTPEAAPAKAPVK